MSTADRSPEHPFVDERPGLRHRLARLSDAEAVAGIGVAGLVVASVMSDHTIEDGPVLCIFRRLTGLPCPGCGLTRSWVYLMHGDVTLAFERNPFGPVLIVAVLVLAVFVVRARVRHTAPPRLNEIAKSRWAQAIFGAWILFGLVRMAYVGFS